jgi:hypothetical protein
MFVILTTDEFLQRVGTSYHADRSHSRESESTPQTFANSLSADWIPAFAGMTGVS